MIACNIARQLPGALLLGHRPGGTGFIGLGGDINRRFGYH